MGTNSDLKSRLLERLEQEYYKVMLVNFSTGLYQVTRPPSDEAYLQDNASSSITDYFDWFSNSDLLHADDRAAFKTFAKTANPQTSIIYRRRLGEHYRHVIMAFLKMPSYSDNNQECLLYVKDIEREYQSEYDAVVEKIGTIDHVTGLYNNLAAERDFSKCNSGMLGVVYADINGLKYMNDTTGSHAAGDALIKQFADLLSIQFKPWRCYHLHGDEFIVLAIDCNPREFITKAIDFHKSLWIALEHPMASVGYSVGSADEKQLVYDEAEKQMYEDKHIFYARFPKYARK